MRKKSNEQCTVNAMGTAFLLPFKNVTDIYYLLNDSYVRHTGSTMLFSNIRSSADLQGNMSLKEKYTYISDTFHISRKLTDKLLIEECNLWKKYIFCRDSFYEKYCELYKRGCTFRFINNLPIDDILLGEILLLRGYEGEIISYNQCIKDEIYVMETPSDVADRKNIDLSRPVRLACGNLMSMEYSVDASIGYNALLSVVKNKFFDDIDVKWKEHTISNNKEYNIGFYLLGMHLVGIVKWIADFIHKSQKDYSSILFSARDGFLVMKAYNEYRKIDTELPEAEYIQASRKILLPFLYVTHADFFEPPGEYNQYSPKTLLKLFFEFTNLCNIESYNCNSFSESESIVRTYVEDASFEYETHFGNYRDYVTFVNWFLDNLYSVDNHEVLKRKVAQYYSSFGDTGLIFDMGYSGRLQKCISDATGYSYDVLYLLSDEHRMEINERNSNISVYNFYDFTPSLNNELREFIMSENAPSAIGLKYDEDKYIPIFDEPDGGYPECKEIINLQTGAIDYVETVYGLFGLDIDLLPFKPQEVSMPFEGYFREIPEGDMKIFEKCYQENYHFGVVNNYSWGNYYKWVMRDRPRCLEPIYNRFDNNLEQKLRSRKKLLYFGTGKVCENLLNKYPSIRPDYLIDNNIQDKMKWEIPVLAINKLLELDDIFIVVTTKYYSEIAEQLENLGYIAEKDFIWYQDL